jgi:hypothetical protein
MYASPNENGVVVYRCHRVEVGPSQCRYWIGYEPALLPYVLQRFLPDLRAMIAARKAEPAPAAVPDEAESLRKRAAALEARLQKGRARYLDAPAAVAAGLLATLEGWEEERKGLLARAEAMGRPAAPDLGAEWEEWFADANTADRLNVVSVPGAPAVLPNGVTAYNLDIVPCPELKAMLERLGTRMDLWFRPKAKGRGYDLHKVRVRATLGGAVDYLAQEGAPNWTFGKVAAEGRVCPDGPSNAAS